MVRIHAGQQARRTPARASPLAWIRIQSAPGEATFVEFWIPGGSTVAEEALERVERVASRT